MRPFPAIQKQGWTVVTTSTKHSAQATLAKKAAKLKAENEAKRPQPHWLQSTSLVPTGDAETPPPPEQVRAANRSQGPPRLLSKKEVLAITNKSYPTIWAWMRAGKFPRSLVVGGRSMWRSDQVLDQWLAALPVRRLKGDDAEVVA
jgi:predicted DNA-binding transcriptional regulator AlpA